MNSLRSSINDSPESISALKGLRHLPPSLVTAWTDALRSGQYVQSHGSLFVDESEAQDGKPVGYCCLGVCQMVKDGEVEMYERDNVSRGMPSIDWTDALVGDKNGPEVFGAFEVLWRLNDMDQFTFSQIADVIEEAVGEVDTTTK